jgi:hypothetical protein
VEFLVSEYICRFEKDHPSYLIKEWMRFFDSFSLSLKDSNGKIKRITSEQMKIMMLKYFDTDFGDSCDRSILHFNTDKVKEKLFNEIQEQSKGMK